MKIEFIKDGENTKVGSFVIGDIKEVANDIARLLIKKGIAKEIKLAKEPKKEFGNGGK
jgi:hypothetical protein